MGQQHISLSLTTRSDRDWSAAYNLLAGVILDHGNEFAQTSLSTVDVDDVMSNEDVPDKELFYDERTAEKARSIITHEINQVYGYVADDVVTSIVNALTDKGILFRERKS